MTPDAYTSGQTSTHGSENPIEALRQTMSEQGMSVAKLGASGMHDEMAQYMIVSRPRMDGNPFAGREELEALKGQLSALSNDVRVKPGFGNGSFQLTVSVLSDSPLSSMLDAWEGKRIERPAGRLL